MSGDVAAAKVGLLIIIALALLVGAYLYLGGVQTGRGTYEIIVAFPDSQGLKRGDKVLMHGVQIGQVHAVVLEYHDREFLYYPAAAYLRIRDEYPLYRNDRFMVESSGLIGEHFVGVRRDPAAKFESAIEPGTKIKGETSAGLTDLIDETQGLVAEAKTAVGSIQSVVGDRQAQQQLLSAIQKLQTAMATANKVAEEALLLVKDARSVVRRKDAQVEPMIENLEATVANLRRASAGVNAVIATTTVPQDISAAARSVRATADSAKHTATTIEDLVTAPETSDNVRATLRNLREATEEGKQAVEKANRVLGRVDQATEKPIKLGRKLRDIEVTGQLDVQWGTSHAWRSDVNLDFRLRPDAQDFYRLGVRDFGDAMQLNLQRGVLLPANARLRYGLIGSELGVGYDRRMGRRTGLEADLWRPDDLRLDLRGTYQYRKDTDLLFGIDDFLGDNSIFFGARRKLEF